MRPFFIFCSLFFFASCTKDVRRAPEGTGYPQDVENILVLKCAVSGCHNTQSARNANGLDFSTWNSMFRGGRNGSSVIPYSAQFSYMLYSVNTDTLLGQTLQPLMPYNRLPLTRNEYLLLRDWVAAGAPDDNGLVKFSDNPARSKLYVTMQGCDQVGVFDAETRVVMRYISVGIEPQRIEAPHQVRVTPDGKYWAVVFYAGDIVQFFNTSDDRLVATVPMPPGGNVWNTIVFTPDSRKAYVASTIPVGPIVEINIPEFTRTTPTPILVANPHGSYITKDGSMMYVTNQNGNSIYKIPLTGPFKYSPDELTIPSPKSLQPHEIIFSPDESKYFITCQNPASNEVMVFRTADDGLDTTFKVGQFPQEMTVSHTRPYLFVTCQEDASSPGKKGSVYIINYLTNQVVGTVYPGYQPHGIAVDDDRGLVYVANRNVSTTGPAPHHSSSCGGRNGYISIIDMNTLKLLQVSLPDGYSYEYKNEVLNDPYFITFRK